MRNNRHLTLGRVHQEAKPFLLPCAISPFRKLGGSGKALLTMPRGCPSLPQCCFMGYEVELLVLYQTDKLKT